MKKDIFKLWRNNNISPLYILCICISAPAAGKSVRKKVEKARVGTQYVHILWACIKSGERCSICFLFHSDYRQRMCACSSASKVLLSPAFFLSLCFLPRSHLAFCFSCVSHFFFKVRQKYKKILVPYYINGVLRQTRSIQICSLCDTRPLTREIPPSELVLENQKKSRIRCTTLYFHLRQLTHPQFLSCS